MTPKEQRTALAGLSPEQRAERLGVFVLPPGRPATPNEASAGQEPPWGPEPQKANGANAEQRRSPKFVLIPYREIVFSTDEEWLIKRFLPRSGVALLYGKPQTLKSFVALDIGLHAAAERAWARRRTERAATVYLCGEGAGGFLKRVAGFRLAHPDWPDNLPFHLIKTAPNLGGQRSDLPELIAAIESANVKPGLIIIDTLAQTLGGAEENGVGMVTFLSNCNTLASHFNALVLAVHHVGLAKDEQKRPRGHSSIGGGVDAQILVEREEGALSTALTLQKLKDEEANVRFKVTLARRVIDYDRDREEISTLVVDGAEEIKDGPATPKESKWSAPLQLFRAVLLEAIAECGLDRRPGLTGPLVRMVDPEKVRPLFYRRYVTGDGSDKAQDTKRRAFTRQVKAAVEAGLVCAEQNSEGEFIWLP